MGHPRRRPRKKVSLELGNNAPVMVEPGGDWEQAADPATGFAGFAFTREGLEDPDEFEVAS